MNNRNSIPLKPDNSNLFVDDSGDFVIRKDTGKALQALTKQASAVKLWCDENRVKIHPTKTKIMPDEQTNREFIKVKDLTTKASKDGLKYLGIQMMPNLPGSRSSIQIGIKAISDKIHTRCKFMTHLRSLVKWKYYNEWRRLTTSFVGGQLNYYCRFLGAEIYHEETLRPLTKAYNHCMRVLTGCMRRTPIPILHAISRCPPLVDKITMDQAYSILAAVACNNILGNEVLEWQGSKRKIGAGWSPYETARQAITDATPDTFNGNPTT